MRVTWVVSTVAVIPFLAGCGGNPAPVPVLGTESETAMLVGEWTGEYSSVETGRAGSIYLRLAAGAETARGDVLMVPSDRAGHDHPEGEHPASEYLPITFVRIRGGMVRGTLDPYVDPGCRCRVETTFEGRLRGDTISGTYTTLRIDGGLATTGRWRTVRTRATRFPPASRQDVRPAVSTRGSAPRSRGGRRRADRRWIR